AARFVLALCAGLLTARVGAESQLRLASPFSDHMVLQRDLPVPVWGSAEAGEKVTVEFAGQKKSTSADAGGRWRVDLDPLAASTEARAVVVAGADPQRRL